MRRKRRPKLKRRRFSAKLNNHDRDFLKAEGLRITREEFARTGEVEIPSTADVVSELLEELRCLREETGRSRSEAG